VTCAPSTFARNAYGVAEQQKPTLALALRELEACAGTFLAVLLAFVFTGITSEQAGFLEGSTQFGIEFHQCTSDAKTDGAGLTGNTAAIGQNDYVKTILHFDNRERELRRDAASFGGEILVKRASVDRDLAGTTRAEEYTGDAAFAASCCEILFDFLYGQNLIPS